MLLRFLRMGANAEYAFLLKFHEFDKKQFVNACQL